MIFFARNRRLWLTLVATLIALAASALPLAANYGIRGLDSGVYAEFPLSNLYPLAAAGAVVIGLMPATPAAEAFAARSMWAYRATTVMAVSMVFCALMGAAAEFSGARDAFGGIRDTFFYMGLALIGSVTGRPAAAYFLPCTYLAAATIMGASGGGSAKWWVLPEVDSGNLAAAILAVVTFAVGSILFIIHPPRTDPVTEDVA